MLRFGNSVSSVNYNLVNTYEPSQVLMLSNPRMPKPNAELSHNMRAHIVLNASEYA